MIAEVTMESSLIKSLPLIVVIITAAVDGLWGWGVNYSPSYVCALKGSTVKMSCTLKYPCGHVIRTAFWTKHVVIDGEPSDLCSDPENRGEIQCLMEDKDTYSITLKAVTEADKHIYYCRFTTDIKGGNWTGIPGIQLDVTDLQVETQQSVKENDSVNLTCKSSCSLPEQTTFVWYRNTRILTEGIENVNQIQLQPVNLSDVGNYQCAVRGSDHKISPPVYLNVEYPPKSVSVSISSSGEITSGGSVTLSCSSDSNPPALNFTWFKGETLLGSGDTYSITNIKSEASGNYYCTARNKHGSQSSAAVNVNVMYPPKSVSVSVSPSGEIVLGDSVTLSCSSDSNPPALNFTWFKGGKFVGSGRIFNISKISSDHSGGYKCRSINEHGEKDSDTVMLNVMYPPKSVSVSISPSGEIVSGDSVTLICSSDSNPPAEISWFKGGKFVGSGRIFNISKISSDHSGGYMCRSRNKHGEKDSDTVTLNVMYPPKRVSVSVSPSGEITSGDSVTLSCSSDSNPPALNFSWFKEGKSVGSGQSFSISKISSDHSGGYMCRSRNKHGEKDSDTVTLNVMYPPKSVSVSVSPSGEITSGDSVTLNCSSDSNPPALNFSWFKENESSAVGSGQSFSISSFNSSFSGRFYCEAQNKYGSQRSASVSLTVKVAQHTGYWIMIVLIFIIIIIIIVVFIKRKKIRGKHTSIYNCKTVFNEFVCLIP
ncbi:B-cell receptor CD22-like isoform X2 [Megalobrama amblycephala]|uniref:B-cell receptor CD22-like isoform X2 n=1 Tax=Megalobrama amblycephala TaxID=75352 RepID=UPI00201429AE|nr:B-cell receptor CD22-like isoform X2 [Megalobrama amblycephala]